MLFCSQQYLLFFTLVFAVYWMMPWQKARVYLLLAASLYFYARWNHWLAAIIAVSTTLDYFVARAIDGTLDTRRRKLLLSVTGSSGNRVHSRNPTRWLELRTWILEACLPKSTAELPRVQPMDA